jgi:hypothetical protein
MWPLPEWSRLTDEADELAYLMARAADASRADVSGMTDDQILEHFGFRKVMDGCECQMPPAAVAAEIAPIVPIETVFDPGHWSHWRRHVEVAIWLEAAGLARRRIAGLRERATTARSRHR